MKKWVIKSGIQRKYLRYIMGLLLLAILLSSIGVWIYVRQSLTTEVTDKYEFLNEKMGLALDTLSKEADEGTAECITYDQVQESLKKASFADVEKNSLQKYFAYMNLDHVAEYCYVDNKNNVYARSYSHIDYEDFSDSHLEDYMGDSYAKTQWFWAKDTLFGTAKEALFIGRYVHSMEYASKPGLLLIKMNDSFLETILGKDRSMTDEVQIGILDKKGNLCAAWCPKGTKISDAVKQEVYKISAQKTSGILAKSRRVSGGVCSIYKESSSEMTVFTVVPSSVMTQGTMRVLTVLIGIYLFVAVVAVVLSIYFSKRFTSPIREISEEMTQFDGNDFSRLIELNTNTELDQIGHSYNKMLKNIENLLAEIKEQEGVLRRTELNMLLAQINPHFLYNTLDTIYMLARINGEETTMKMIQALSRYLRLSLSKGSDIVTVEDELENVKNYVRIQNYRFRDKFTLKLELDDLGELPENYMMPTLTLQPIVENAIHHGLEPKISPGTILIRGFLTQSKLILQIRDNGVGMSSDQLDTLRARLFQSDDLAPVRKEGEGARHGAGIALKNVHQRLQLFFGPAYGLEITSAAGIGTQIELCMPAPSEMRDSYHAERAF